jgi:hypothetical protein
VESGRASFERIRGLDGGWSSTCIGAEGLAALGSKARARCSSGASAVSATEIYQAYMKLTVASGKVC